MLRVCLLLVVSLFSVPGLAALADGIIAVSPAPNAVDVTPSASITIEYSVPASYAYTVGRKLRVRDQLTGVEVFAVDPDETDSQAGQTSYEVQLPTATLLPGRQYEVDVSFGFAVINQAPWKSGAYSWSFSTASLEPAPLGIDNITQVFPANGAELVPTDTPIVLEYPASSSYAYTTGRFLTLRNLANGEVVFEVDAEAADPQSGQTVYTLNLPAGTLKPGEQYGVEVTYGFANINQAPWKTGHVGAGQWQFTTAPANGEPLSTAVDGFAAVFPAPNSVNVDPGTNLVVDFSSEANFLGTNGNELAIIDLGTNDVVFAVDPDELSSAQDATRLTITLPTNTLEDNTTYGVSVDYQFAYFNAAPWRTDVLHPIDWQFTTGQSAAQPLPIPAGGIASVYPADGAVDISPNTNIDVNFTARTLFGYTTGSALSLVDTRDDSVIASIDPEYQDAQEGGYRFRFSPANPLEAGVTYEVQLAYSFARFNEVPWISDVASWTFTVAGTLAPPPVEDPPSEEPPSEEPPTEEPPAEEPPVEEPTVPGVSATTGTVMFVTQTPVSGISFATVVNNFANHVPFSRQAPRGGDLWIRYPDGQLRNLTQEAGFGEDGEQGVNAIAVRSPSVHWDGNKALFSMVVGSPALFETTEYFWQIYEVTGLGQGEVATITKVPNQPQDYNNVSAIYAATSSSNAATEDIIFESDMTHGGRHLYPQYEEYDGARITTGLFRLNPNTGGLKRLTHSPSGDFTPIIDDFGRLIFVRWDHLQRDQQNGNLIGGVERFGAAMNYVDESVGAPVDTVNGALDVFPEHLVLTDPNTGLPTVVNNETGHRFNQFFLWESSPVDGSENEVLNHLGRQELGQSYSIGRFTDDPAMTDITTSFQGGHTTNTVPIYAPGGTFHPKEDPAKPGAFYMTHAQEFAYCGEIVYLDSPPGKNPETINVTKRTEYFDTDTSDGCYRNPLPMSDGVMVAAYTPEDFGSDNQLTGTFRLRFVNEDGTPGGYLTNGISEQVSYYSPDFLISHNGNLWELDPVEVRVRTRPTTHGHGTILAAPEQTACETAFGDTASCDQGMQDFRNYLAANDLALVVSRNVTSRDDSDTQQPFNLRVPGGVTSDASLGLDKIYDVTHLQFLQANLVRGYANRPNGRRTLAQYMSDSLADGLNSSQEGAVTIGTDGSVAAIVPAERAMTWHLVDEAQSNKSIVSERYWVSFAAGEVRVCANCHGINDVDQMGNPEPTNPPQALTDLLNAWQALMSSSED